MLSNEYRGQIMHCFVSKWCLIMSPFYFDLYVYFHTQYNSYELDSRKRKSLCVCKRKSLLPRVCLGKEIFSYLFSETMMQLYLQKLHALKLHNLHRICCYSFRRNNMIHFFPIPWQGSL